MVSHVHRRTALLAAIALGMAAAPVAAQEAAGVGTIEGTVREQTTNRPVEAAQVHVVGKNIGASTNRDGFYRITNVPVGPVELRIRMVGFSPTSRTVTVTAGATQTVNFTLSASAVQLEAIVTTGTAGATEVKRLGNTVATIDPPKYAPISIESSRAGAT